RDAVAHPVPRGTEDALVEEPVFFRTERAVIDRLGLRDLAARPRPDLVRRRERDADRVELVYFKHSLFTTLKTADVDAEVRLVERGVLDEADRFLEDATFRSEEHTSELQSHLNLVCRLLLDKKKVKTYTINASITET